MKKPKSYKEAIHELEGIKEKMDKGVTDLDQLLKDVERADYLIKWCNERLDSIEKQVVDILEEGYEEE